MARFWVVGGTYMDTNFETIVGGGSEERIGPFPTYDEAKLAWQARAWKTVDDANTRYRIEQEVDHTDRPVYWVVGGVYSSTDFRECVTPGGEEEIGPFRSHDEAKRAWQEKAWATVDDAHARYRIEKRYPGHDGMEGDLATD